MTCANGGDDFLVALVVSRRGGNPLYVYGTGLTGRSDLTTRRSLKSAATLLFNSLPVAQRQPMVVSRNPKTGLIWAGAPASTTGGRPLNMASSTANTQGQHNASAASAAQQGGGPAATGAVGCVGQQGGGGAGGGATMGGQGGGGLPGGDVSAIGSVGGGLAAVGATTNDGRTPAAAGATPAPSAGPVLRDDGFIFPSADGTAEYPPLPDLPIVVGTAAASSFTGKRTRAESEAGNPPAAQDGAGDGAAPKEVFLITEEMSKHLKDKLSAAKLSFTRKHMADYMALVKLFYEWRLKRSGTNTPYEPLFPRACVGVLVNYKAIYPAAMEPLQLQLQNSGLQTKYATACLIIYMINATDDKAYECILDRYCSGMRTGKPGATADKPRKPRAHSGMPRMTDKAGGDEAAGALGGQGRQGFGGGGGSFLTPCRGPGSLAAAPGDRGRLARYFSVTSPSPLPPISNELRIDGVVVGTGDVHLEFRQHHGADVPGHMVSVFCRSSKVSDPPTRYPFDVDQSFCLERGHAQETELTLCINQRVVWRWNDIGYVGWLCSLLIVSRVRVPMVTSLSVSHPLCHSAVSWTTTHASSMLVTLFLFLAQAARPFVEWVTGAFITGVGHGFGIACRSTVRTANGRAQCKLFFYCSGGLRCRL